jgi:hypothetical protein
MQDKRCYGRNIFSKNEVEGVFLWNAARKKTKRSAPVHMSPVQGRAYAVSVSAII